MNTEADDEREGPESIPWFDDDEPDSPDALVDKIDGQLDTAGLPNYTALASLLRDVLRPGATDAALDRARLAVYDIAQRIVLD